MLTMTWDKECEHARQFLDEISPRNAEVWLFPGDYVFRGQADANWPLVPAAFRPGAQFLGSLVQNNNFTETQLAVLQELVGLARFVEAADEQGLALPEDSIELRRRYVPKESFANPSGMDEILEDPSRWPPKELLPLLALAQHYGLPTRLLDWTSSPYIAAYFAAREAARWAVEGLPAGTSHLAVWALHTDQIAFESSAFLMPGRERPLRGVAPPRAPNPNMTAQKGVFTFVRPEREPRDSRSSGNSDQRGCHARLVEAHCRAKQKDYALTYSKRAALRRVLLQVEHAPQLLRLLSAEGFHAGSVIPGFAAATQRVREESLWCRAQRANQQK